MRVPRAAAAPLTLLWLAACSALHEELPPEVAVEPVFQVGVGSSDDVRAVQTDVAGGRAPTETASVAPSPLALDALHTRLAASSGGSESPDPALAALVEASVAAFLSTAVANPQVRANVDPVAADLERSLELPLEARGGAKSGRALAADFNGDGLVEVALAIPSAALPVFVFFVGDGQWRAERLPPQWPAGAAGRPQLEIAADYTGDGQAELLYSAFIPGASSTETHLQMAAWREGTPTLLLDAKLSDWAGPAPSPELWSATSGPRPGLELTCAALGPFDAKLLAHPAIVRAYVWDPTRSVFAVTAEDIPPPESARQAANVAEVALRAGDIEAAVPAWEAVLAGRYPLLDGVDVDWPALASYRLGLAYALGGSLVQASIAMGNAGRGALAEPARLFVGALAPDRPAAAFAAAQSHLPQLAESMFQEQAVGLGFPLSAAEVLWPGYPLQAWVAARGMEVLGPEPTTTLQVDLGLAVSAARTLDMDGDGRLELVVVLPEAHALPGEAPEAELWVVTESRGAPVPRLMTKAPSISLADVVELGGGWRALEVGLGPERRLLHLAPGALAWRELSPPHRVIDYHPDLDPRPGREPCRPGLPTGA